VLFLLFFVFLYLCFFLFFHNLAERAFFGVEGRWGEAAREMALRGSWFVPTINFEPHITKPLLPFWLIKISATISGTFNEFTVRLPGAVLAFFTVICFYLLSSRIFEKPWNMVSTGLF